MTRHRFEGSLRSFWNHLDPEKEEQVKWMKTDIKNKVEKISSLAKSIHGNEDDNSKKEPELVHLIEDFHQHYESLYLLYENLKQEVKNNVDTGSISPSDSESYFSPDGSNTAKSSDTPATPQEDYQDYGTPKMEYSVLKDKLTSSSVSKERRSGRMASENLRDWATQREESENAQQLLAQVEELNREVARLKTENETLCAQKQQLEERINCKLNEAMQMEEKLSEQEDRIMELESTPKESENTQVWEDKDKSYLSRISDLVAQTDNLQLQVDELNLQKRKLEERLLRETKEWPSEIKGLMEQVDSSQKELDSVNIQKTELELEHKKKTAEASDCLLQTEILRKDLMNCEEKDKLEIQVKELGLKLESLSSEKIELEEQIAKKTLEAQLENQELRRKMSNLQKSLSEREMEVSIQQKKSKSFQDEMSARTESLNEKVKKHEKTLVALRDERNTLQAELEALHNEKRQLALELEQQKQDSTQKISQLEKLNSELTEKITEQQKTLLDLGHTMEKLKDENMKCLTPQLLDSKINPQVFDRKLEEMAEEIRNQFEVKYRMLSRRIKVAEQLQVENKEWCQRTKEIYEEKSKILKEWMDKTAVNLEHVKDMSESANDILVSLDRVALRFEERTANFLNRISKASCELKFAKDWVKRKNETLFNIKNELESLLSQLDEKEVEILTFREKIWKLEHKVRESDKLIKSNEDGMLGLQEEKREAIRQLCVWIDYHKSQSDYYKKMLSEICRKKPS